MNYNEILEATKRKVADPSDVQDGKIWETMINEAVDRYSRHRPLEKVEDIPGAGTFNVALPSDYLDGFSYIKTVEYPFVATQQNPTIIKQGRDYKEYRDASTVVLRMLRATPTASETVRLTYTTVHVLTTSATTIPRVDEQAVVNLSASLMCEALAAEFEKRTRSSMPETTFDLRSKANEYQTQADRYNRIWMEMMGISADGAPGAAIGVADFDMRLSNNQEPLTHPTRNQ